MMPARSAVVLIDLQNFQSGRSLGPRSTEEVVTNANRLIEAGRRAGSLIVYVRSSHLASGGDALKVVADNRPAGHGGQADGWDDLHPQLVSPRPDQDPVTIKRGWDAFYGSSMDLQLRRHGVDTIVMAGISTNFGVEGTARAAVDRGYEVLFAEDAMASADDALHHFAITRIFPRIGRVMSSEQVTARLEEQVQFVG